jgi:hypothetical protein
MPVSTGAGAAGFEAQEEMLRATMARVRAERMLFIWSILSRFDFCLSQASVF